MDRSQEQGRGCRPLNPSSDRTTPSAEPRRESLSRREARLAWQEKPKAGRASGRRLPQNSHLRWRGHASSCRIGGKREGAKRRKRRGEEARKGRFLLTCPLSVEGGSERGCLVSRAVSEPSKPDESAEISQISADYGGTVLLTCPLWSNPPGDLSCEAASGVAQVSNLPLLGVRVKWKQAGSPRYLGMKRLRREPACRDCAPMRSLTGRIGVRR